MNITDIKIRKTYGYDKLKALVSITIDGDLAVHDIKIIESDERVFVAMPSRKDDKGIFRDIVHPIGGQARAEMEHKIIAAYEEYMAKMVANCWAFVEEESVAII